MRAWWRATIPVLSLLAGCQASSASSSSSSTTALGSSSAPSEQKICAVDQIGVYRAQQDLSGDPTSHFYRDAYDGALNNMFQDAEAVGGQWAEAVPNEAIPDGGPADQESVSQIGTLCGNRFLNGGASTTATTVQPTASTTFHEGSDIMSTCDSLVGAPVGPLTETEQTVLQGDAGTLQQYSAKGANDPAVGLLKAIKDTENSGSYDPAPFQSLCSKYW